MLFGGSFTPQSLLLGFQLGSHFPVRFFYLFFRDYKLALVAGEIHDILHLTGCCV